MNRKHLLRITLALFFVCLGVILYKTEIYLEKKVKLAVQDYGAELTGVGVEIDDIELDFLDASLVVKGLRVGNPAGFANDYSIKLGQGTIKIDIRSVLTNTVVIKTIHIEDPEIHYEQASEGSNLDVIVANARKNSQSDNKAALLKKLPRWTVDNFYAGNISLGLRLDLFKGKTAGLRLPDIHIKQPGKSPHGTQADKIIEEIMVDLKSGIGIAVASRSLGNGIDSFTRNNSNDHYDPVDWHKAEE